MSQHSSLTDRDLRQRDLIPPGRLANCQAVVVGVGAIGRQVALQLAAIGIPEMHLFDPDVVGVENLAPQGYWAGDLQHDKVMATAEVCRRINPDIQLHTHARRFQRSAASGLQGPRRLIVFACVDSITTRRLLWESLHAQTGLFVDGRMSAEVIRVVTVAEPKTDGYYPTTLFDTQEAFTGSCTAKSTIYTASIAAGLMLSQFTRWLRGLSIDPDVMLNLLASELTTCTSHGRSESIPA